jgi:hypothetical protein
MIYVLRNHWEKLVLGAALVLILVAANWWWRQRSEREALRRTAVKATLIGTAYEARLFPDQEIAPPVWAPPAAQSRGPEWRYELFTPPDIYFDSVAPAAAEPEPGETAARKTTGTDSRGFELLAVKREPYRLQLAGYAGTPGDYLAAFVSPRSAEIFLARPGQRFAELGLTFERFEVRKQAGVNADGWPTIEFVARAVLRDEQTGGEITLDDRGRRLTENPLAVLRIDGAKSRPRELRIGDAWRGGEGVYRIERIQLDPPEVVVSRQIPGSSQPELCVLRPALVAAEDKLVRRPPKSPGPQASLATTNEQP